MVYHGFLQSILVVSQEQLTDKCITSDLKVGVQQIFRGLHQLVQSQNKQRAKIVREMIQNSFQLAY